MDNTNYRGWNTRGHLETFDFWNGMPKAEFLFKYGAFQEHRYLRTYLAANSPQTMLDVGCATGTTYRFVKLIGAAAKTSYAGIDISQTAIERAQHVHPDGQFDHVELADIGDALSTQQDLVVSRDTIMHQECPYPFLNALLGCARNALIVRLRTRDTGATVLNTAQSCQAHYNAFWMPYIVLNTDELLSEIASNPRVKRVRINRSYQVLGGKNGRYLPKELYFDGAGGAETTVMVELGPGDRTGDAEIVTDSELEGHDYILAHTGKRAMFKAFNAASAFLKGMG